MKALQFATGISGLCLFALSAFADADHELRYKHEYVCNGERIVVDYCRRDSDSPGQAPTVDEQNFCMVYYPDRPKQGGFLVQKVELRNDLLKKLQACGAFGASSGGIDKPQGAGKPAATVAPRPAATAATAAKEHLALAVKYSDANESQKAIAEYQKVIELKPDNKTLVEAYSGMAGNYLALHQLDKVISCYQQLAALDPDNAANIWALGDAYFKALRFSEAAAAFKEAVRLDPADKLYNTELGESYLLTGRKAEAMQVYKALLKVDKDSAKYLLDEINDPGGPAIVLATEAETMLLGGRDEEPEAMGLLQAALRIKPVDPRGQLRVGEALSFWEHHDEAIAVFRSVIALKPDADVRADAFYEIGQDYNEQQQYAKAIPELKESIRLKPDYFVVENLGDSYFGMKDYPSALASYREEVRLKPDDADGYFKIGTTCAAMNQFDMAIAAYAEVARLEPEAGRGFAEIGNIQLQLKKYNDAGRAFSNALRVEPKNKAGLYGIGRAYLAVGRKPDAMRAYNDLKTLDEGMAQALLSEINKQ
jgi:tetratricopeptide (TPR) repeat protein